MYCVGQTYPLLRAKVMAMSEEGAELGVFGSLNKMYHSGNGFIGMYQGLWAEMCRSIYSGGLICTPKSFMCP